MFKPRFLPGVLAALVSNLIPGANAYEIGADGIPTPKQTFFDFRYWDGRPLGIENRKLGSDFQTELEAGFKAVIQDFDKRICKRDTSQYSCSTGGYTYELKERVHVEGDRYMVPVINIAGYPNVWKHYDWTLRFNVTSVYPDHWVTKPPENDVFSAIGDYKAFWTCPSPLVVGAQLYENSLFYGHVQGPLRCQDSGQAALCPAGYTFRSSATTENKCVLQCAPGSTWNSTIKQCEQEPKEENCKTKSNNPIDFISGRKYRTEEIISVGVKYPFELIYFYNSKNGALGTAAGTVNDRYDTSLSIDDAVPKIDIKVYVDQYNSEGLSKLDSTVLAGQYYGYMHDNWRHNFDDVLQVLGGVYILHTADGKQLSFPGFGFTKSHSQLKLGALNSGAEDFQGYELTDYSNGTRKLFDESGRLRKVVRGINDVLTLTYNQDRLQSIHNSEGASIEVTNYASLYVNSVYSLIEKFQGYPTDVSTSDGRQVTIQWGYSDKRPTRTSYQITKISRPFVSTVEATREFSYDRYSRLLGDIYDIDEIKNQRNLYAHFEYDGQKRAVVSELNGGYERVEVGYVSEDERIVRNAHGLSTTYTFADSEGVRRLQSISGAETANCAPTNTIYTYYPNGTIETQVTNGVTTRFIYNSRNLVETKTEAFGTPSAISTKTCWHDTLNRPERIIEATRVTKFQYHPDGHLKSKAIEARISSNEYCQ